MKLIQCITAFVAVKSLAEQKTDYRSAYNLMLLKRDLAAQTEFYAEKERQLADEFGRRGADGHAIIGADGRFALEDTTRAPEYVRRHAELDALDVEWNAPVRKLSFPESVTPAQLEALEGFVEFTEELP